MKFGLSDDIYEKIKKNMQINIININLKYSVLEPEETTEVIQI